MNTPIVLTRYISKQIDDPPRIFLWADRIIHIQESYHSSGKFKNTWVYYDIRPHVRVLRTVQGRDNKIFVVNERIIVINQKISGDVFELVGGLELIE